MACFSGKVSLGGFPDLSGAVNKLSESVKNIEKNFGTALWFEEKQEKSKSGSSEGLWSFMSHKSEESSTESSVKPESPQQEPKPEEKEGVETEMYVNSATEKTTSDEEMVVLDTANDEGHQETAERVDEVISEHGKVQFDPQTTPIEPPEYTVQSLESSDSVDNRQQKDTSDVGISEDTESGEAKSGPVEADEVKVWPFYPMNQIVLLMHMKVRVKRRQRKLKMKKRLKQKRL